MKKCKNGGFKAFLNRWSVGFLSLAAVIAGIGGYLIALDRVTLIVDGHKSVWKTPSATVAKVLKEKKIVLHPEDQVEPAMDAKIVEGMVVRIKRSFVVHIQTADQKLDYRTTAERVGTILKRAGIGYDADDKVIPALNQVVRPNQTIRVIRLVTKVVIQQTELKSGIEYRRDSCMEQGTRKVVQQGETGMIETKLKTVYEDGKVISRQKLTERVIKPMKNTIVALGIKPPCRMLVTSRGSYRYIEMKHMVATAYSPGPESCGKYALKGRTYTGKKAGYGLVAVDPRVIRLGTNLYIEGYGKAEAADIGSAIKGDRIDLCFETYREAVMFGRKKLKVYILEH